MALTANTAHLKDTKFNTGIIVYQEKEICYRAFKTEDTSAVKPDEYQCEVCFSSDRITEKGVAQFDVCILTS